MSWTHRERLLAALNREEADRVPIDFGSTIATSITLPAYERLKEHLGLEHETAVMSKTSRLANPDDSVLERFDVDTRFLGYGVGSEEIDQDTILDEWGTTWHRAPGGCFMPVDGPFENQEPTIRDLESWNWPDPEDPRRYRGLEERAKALRHETDCAIVLNPDSYCGATAQHQRGFGNWLKDLHRNPQYVCRMLDIIADLWIGIVHRALDAVGTNVDVVIILDDLGTQSGPLFSPEIYRELLKPRHARMIAALKEHGGVKVLFHSCGAVHRFIGDLIDIGVDALNPVQVNADDMDPEQLKKEFGDRLAFWGGIDTQKVLPNGTAEEVAAETRRIIDVLGKGGGLVLNSVHDIQVEVPPENVVAMFDAGLEHSYAKTA